MKHFYGFLLLLGIFILGILSLHTTFDHVGYIIGALAFSLAVSSFFGFVLESSRQEPYVKHAGDRIFAVYFPAEEPPLCLLDYVGRTATWEAFEQDPDGTWIMTLVRDKDYPPASVPITDLLIRDRRRS